MKLQIMSDLHLEFAPYKVQKAADVLILAGDILIARKLNSVDSKYIQFIEDVCSDFEHVIMVAGNHEFYGCGWIKSLQLIKETAAQYDNFHFLEDDIVTIDDVLFVGGTMWTDFNGGDPLTKFDAASTMNDYRKITYDEGTYRRLGVNDVDIRHSLTRGYIDSITAANSDKKVVVVTHHSPSFMSVAPMFANQHITNGLYHSDLSQLIIDRDCIKLWIHGHTHTTADYMIGQCRVVCNPRGYPGEKSSFNEMFTVEV